MNFFDQHVDQRELAFSRLAYSTLEMLRDAVAKREAEGETRAEIAHRIGVDRSQLSRTLNGNVKNMTIKTISDVLFATAHSPRECVADAWENLSQSWSRDKIHGDDIVIQIYPENNYIAPNHIVKSWKNYPVAITSTNNDRTTINIDRTESKFEMADR